MKKIILIALLLLPAFFACDKSSNSGSEGATSVVLSKDKVDLMVGETVSISATVLPESLGMGVVWSVLDKTYADVKDGVITGLAEGVTYVLAHSADGNKKAACMVSVNPQGRYSVTVYDDKALPVSEIYGYPGYSSILSAITSDGEEHEFTWSLEDEAAGSVSSDGVLTLGAAAGTSEDYIYDAQSYLRVTTEDGNGTKIPVRSSLLNGLKVNGEFKEAGTIVTVLEDSEYPLEFLYEGANGPLAIPAGKLNIDFSNNENFSVETTAEGGYKLVTGPSDNVSTKLFISPIGPYEKTELVEFRIDKAWPVKASLAGKSSSTLSFTWTEGISTDDDNSKAYTISLYKDEGCTDLEVSFEIPANDGCFGSRQPRFVFSGLQPGTNYWFRVNETGSDEMISDVIPAATEEFNIVMVSADPASAGDVILAEDFSQLCWAADELTEAAGYDVASSSTAYNSDTKKSFMSREAYRFVAKTGQYAQRSLTAQSVAKKEAGLRIAKWAQGQYARIYVGPGYLFLSTASYGTHIVTPELTSIPEGKTAKLKVTVHASGYTSGGPAVFAVQHGKSFYEISHNNQTNKNTLDLTSNIQTITYEGGITNLQEFEVTLDGVVSGDRIAFGPTTETAKSNNMMIISDMTVQIIELN